MAAWRVGTVGFSRCWRRAAAVVGTCYWRTGWHRPRAQWAACAWCVRCAMPSAVAGNGPESGNVMEQGATTVSSSWAYWRQEAEASGGGSCSGGWCRTKRLGRKFGRTLPVWWGREGWGGLVLWGTVRRCRPKRRSLTSWSCRFHSIFFYEIYEYEWNGWTSKWMRW